MTVAEQAQVFCAMAACGAAAGAVYDVLRMAVRGGAAHIWDLLLGVITAAGMTVTALWLETEAFRLYAFAGVAAGIGLYMLTIGTIVRKVSSAVRNFVKKSRFLHKKSRNDAGNIRKSANV